MPKINWNMTDQELKQELVSSDNRWHISKTHQREACENYIRSQVAKGWQILPEHYDDGGFSGGITYCIAANKHKYYTLFPGRTKKALYQSLFRISTGRFFIRSFRLKEKNSVSVHFWQEYANAGS